MVAVAGNLTGEVARGLGRMFYLVSPADSSWPSLESLPQPSFIGQASPYFLGNWQRS